MPRLPILLVALLLTASACGDSKDDPVFLGPVDAGSAEDAPGVVQPVPGTLGHTACTSSGPALEADLASTVRAVATLESRAIVTLQGSLRALKLDASGCPDGPIASFGDEGAVELEATVAAPLPGGRSLVATASDTLLLDSTGAALGGCADASGQLVVHTLQADADGNAVAVLARSPITLLTTDLSAPASCATSTLQLSPAPFAIAQLAFGRGGGFVTVEQATPVSPLVVARYDAAGVRSATSADFADSDVASLCSATGLVDTAAGVFVTDTTCRRAVVFDGDALFARAEVVFGDAPRGASLLPGGAEVLLVVARTGQDAALDPFERVQLP